MRPGQYNSKGILISVAIVVLSFFSVSCSKVQELAETLPSTALNIQSASLFPAVANQNYANQISVSGGTTPYTFTKISGSLPAGLTLDSSSGTISGVPTLGSVGNYSFEIKVRDAAGEDSQKSLNLRVSDPLTITTASLPTAQPLTSYATALSITGGNAPFTYQASGFPTGISMNPVSGVISGAALVAGSYTVDFIVRDIDGLTATKTLTLSVLQVLALPSVALSKAAVSRVYSATLSATGGLAPYTFSLTSGNLPAGVSLSTAGVLSGTVSPGANARTAAFPFTVRVTDSLAQQVTQTFQIDVSIAPRITDDLHHKLRTAGVGHRYLERIEYTGGVGAVTFSTASVMPNGLTLNATSGFITGIPAGGSAGTYGLIITATDANGLTHSVTKSFKVVASALPKIDFGAPMTTIFPPNGGWPNMPSIVVADLNNDGLQDVAGAGDNSALYIMIGRGNGMFDWYYHSTGGRRLWGLKAVDITKDGILDIVASAPNTNGMVLFQGNNNWTVPAAITQQWIAFPGTAQYQFDVKDINGDTFPDIVLAQWNAVTIQILLNCRNVTTVAYNGNPTEACNTTGQTVMDYHAPAAFSSTSNAFHLMLEDMNNDGINDIVSSLNNNNVAIRLGVGNGTFLAATFQATLGNQPRSIAVADLNADGFKDIVVTHTGTHTISVISGNGAGGFIGVNNYSNTDLGGNGEHVELGDVDNDGDLDIIAPAQNTFYTYIWRNNGSAFGNRIVYRVGPNPTGARFANVITGETRPQLLQLTNWGNEYPSLNVIRANELLADNPFGLGSFEFAGYPLINVATQGAPAIADINSDGRLDYLIKTQGASAINLGMSAEDFDLQLNSVPNGEGSANSWFGKQHIFSDFNGDGVWDYAAASWNAGAVGSATVLLGVGDGTFSGQSSFATTNSCAGTNQGARSIDAADVNQDGRMDLIVAGGCSISPGAQVYIFFGYGDGTFNTISPVALSTSGNYADVVIARDINGDGRVDLAVAGNNANLQLYIGNGNGTFALPSTQGMSIAGNITQLRSGDFNGDGLWDFVASTISGASWSYVAGSGSGNGSTLASASPNLGTAPSAANGLLQTSFIGGGIVVVDWDDDGRLDVLWQRDRVGFELFRGLGTGVFSGDTRLSTNACIFSNRWSYQLIEVRDMNNDGLPDLVCSNTAANSGVNFNRSR